MDISQVSVKPYIVLVGDYINSIPLNGNYTEQGVLASEVKEGDNDLDYEIVEGEVNTDVAGFYVVTYKATNSYGWSSYAYRAVLVYDGNPDDYIDISGTYRQGQEDIDDEYGDVTKDTEHKGYWIFENIYTNAQPIPAIVADLGNGENYMVVPGESEIHGCKYEGDIIKVGIALETHVILESIGEPSTNMYFWDHKK